MGFADTDRVRGIAQVAGLTLAREVGPDGRYYLVNSRARVVHSAASLARVERFLQSWAQHVR